MKRTYSISFTLITDLPVGRTSKRRLQEFILRAICDYFKKFYVRGTEVGVQVDEIKEVIEA